MKTASLFAILAASVIVTPMTALAAPITLHCNLGDIKISDSLRTGATQILFRKETFGAGESLCDRKANAYCSADRKDPDVVRLTRTVRGGATADGEALLSYEYVVDLRSRTVTSRLTDRFGSVFSDSVSVCRADGERIATR